MAKKIKKKKNFTAPRKKEKKKENKTSQIMIFVVIAAMLFSGLYMLRWSPPSEGGEGLPEMDAYSLREIGNYSIVTSIQQIRPELVSKVNTLIRLDTIEAVQNTSLPGLKEIILEVGDPSLYREPGTNEVILGGTYILFRFILEEVDENMTSSLRDELDSDLGGRSYDLLKACVGTLPINLSGPDSDSVYIPCDLDTEVGDYFRVFLLEKTQDGLFGGAVGFTTKKLPIGPVVEAEVVNVTGVLVQGIIESDFRNQNLSFIPADEMEVVSPQFIVDSALDNETLEGLEALEGVFTSTTDNKTIVYFNSSSAEVMGIMESEGASYTLEPGSLMFTTTEDADLYLINITLDDAGVTNISFRKTGFVSLPPEVVINDQAASIPNNDNFNAFLGLDTQAGSKVNVSLITLQFGRQVYILSAEET